MRPTTGVALCCVLLGATPNANGSAAGLAEVELSNKSFDAEAKQLSYELRNHSDRTVTAWRLSLARGDARGRAERSVLDQDFFLTASEDDGSSRQQDGTAVSRPGPLPPGESLAASWTLDLDGPVSDSDALSLELVAVVFEDLGFAGDRDAVETLLEARAIRLEAIAELARSLESEVERPRSGPAWQAAFEQRARALRQAAAEPPGAAMRREAAAQLSATRVELAEWLQTAADEIAVALDPEQRVESLATELRRRLDVAAAAAVASEGGAR